MKTNSSSISENEDKVKPFLPKFDEFLIKRLHLKTNSYTKNDFLYFKKGTDYSIYYNPRCQLLDFNPVELPNNSFPSARYKNKCVQEVKKWWEDLCWDFFLLYGQNPNQFVVVRIYGVQYGNFKENIVVSSNDLGEWDEVENWAQHSQKYLKRVIFKYAFFGSLETGYCERKYTKIHRRRVEKLDRQKAKQEVLPRRYQIPFP